MAIFSKTKSSATDKTSDKKNVLDMVKEPKVAKVSLSAEGGSASGGKENTGRAHLVLKSHHLSEKTNALAQNGRYVFVVAKSANKIEVKKAVEAVYEVHVASVNMVNVQGKARRQGRSRGFTSDWKKAVVTLKTGERIAALSEGV